MKLERSAKSDGSYRCLSYVYRDFPALFDINNMVSNWKTFCRLYSLNIIIYLLLAQLPLFIRLSVSERHSFASELLPAA